MSDRVFYSTHSVAYYSSESLRYCYIYTPVTDKRGNIIETKYKVSQGKTYLYTLNMYHTKCSYLVNGRNPEHFLTIDLVSMIELVMAKLQKCGTSVCNENESLRNTLQQLKLSKSDRQSSDKYNNLAQIHELCDHTEDLCLPQTPNIQQQGSSISEIENSDSISESTSQSHDDVQISIEHETGDNLNRIIDEIMELKKLLSTHIKSNDLQIMQLRDEITASKNHTSVCSQHIQNELGSLCDTSRTMCTQIRDSTEMVHRKLQSSLDILRTFKLKDRNENQNAPKNVSTENADMIRKKGSVGVTPTSCADIPIPTYSGVTRGAVTPTLDAVTQLSNVFTPTRGGVAQTIVATTPSRSGDTQTHALFTKTNRANAKQFPTTPSLSPILNQTKSDHIHKDTCTSNTLLVGSSILKGISKRGLSNNTDIESISGAKICTIAHKLRVWDLSVYSTVIIYVGGNDISSKDTQTIYTELTHIVDYLQSRNITVYMCTLCPRIDVDVVPTNDALRQLAEDRQANLIDIYSSFIYGDGKEALHLYARDQIHLNQNGCRTLLRGINRCVPIVKATQHATKETSSRDYTSVNGGEPQRSDPAGYVQPLTHVGYCRNNVFTGDQRHNPVSAGYEQSTTNVGYHHQNMMYAGNHRLRAASIGYQRKSSNSVNHPKNVAAGDHQQKHSSVGVHRENPASAGLFRSSKHFGIYRDKDPSVDYRHSPASDGRFGHEPDHRRNYSSTGSRQDPAYPDYRLVVAQNTRRHMFCSMCRMQNHWTYDCKWQQSRKPSRDLYHP